MVPGKKLSRGLLNLLCVAGIAGGGLACGDGSATPYILAYDFGPPAASEFALRNTLRQLWVDHVVWTRMVIIDVAAGRSSIASVARLQQNQTEIGDAIVPFYGKAAGETLSKLLNQHVRIAAEILAAAKAGKNTALTDARARWSANADQIAQFLAAANPHWQLADLKTMMRMHLDQTLAEATARLSGDYAGDISAYDTAVSHILQMADALSDGIARQFPDQVPRSTLTAKNEELHRTMRKLWMDHVVWTRMVLITSMAKLADADRAAGRLRQNQVEIGDAIAPFYGKEVGGALTRLLHDHLTIASEIVSALKALNDTKLAEANARWNANGDQIAEFLAAANPSWSQADLKTMLRMHLKQTLTEAKGRLRGDSTVDIGSYDKVASNILKLADALSDGIARQFPGLLP